MNNVKNHELELLNLDEQLLDLSEDEQKAIRGGVATCVYQGQPSTQGATVTQADGVYKCQEDGSWQKVSSK
ncbi:hypothetical protein IQ276_038075 [Desmonostoc muscorum LEGE 12446]|uniref:DUF1496 domain-containing protein n=1 Tax=Desmonostoc muscorum LEGE 12446 TaxID=1828758 RepID=A0A8J7AF87_DESMC|nr:DUF1496 domain-containing protein [Desmonostoc muscorum]MCF2152104.1 hypothetical protein [Desmonostoc muscorum LEGE 12446]